MDDLLDLLKTSLRIEEPLEPETPLISSGLIDSFDIVALLGELEAQYGVAIQPEEIDVATFDTPRQILAQLGVETTS